MELNPPKLSSITHRREFGNPIVQIVLVLIVLALFSWFVLKPKLTQTLARQAELTAARQQMADIESDQAELDRLVSDLKSSDSETKLLDEAIPLSARASKVHVLLDGLVRATGMNLSQASVVGTEEIISAGDKTELANPYKIDRQLYVIKVSASVAGTMDQFRNLLQLLETNGRVLDVESVDITSGEGISQFRINVQAYAYENVL
jgi:Tfp pilus assembly protein PilO